MKGQILSLLPPPRRAFKTFSLRQLNSQHTSHNWTHNSHTSQPTFERSGGHARSPRRPGAPHSAAALASHIDSLSTPNPKSLLNSLKEGDSLSLAFDLRLFTVGTAISSMARFIISVGSSSVPRPRVKGEVPPGPALRRLFAMTMNEQQRRHPRTMAPEGTLMVTSAHVGS